MICIDLLLIGVATLLALALRDDFSLSTDRMRAIAPYLAATIAAAAMTIPVFGLPRTIWRLSAGRDFERVVHVALATVIGALALGFTFNRLADVPRALPLLQFGLIAGLMLGVRAIVRRRGEAKVFPERSEIERSSGTARSAVLLVGVNPIAELYLRAVSQLGAGEIEIVGILGRNQRQVGRRLQSHRILGLPENVREILRNLEVEGIHVDRLVIAVPMHKLSTEALIALREIERSTDIVLHPIADRLGLGLGEEPPSDMRRELANLTNPEYSLSELRLIAGRSYHDIKRVLDCAAAGVLLVLGLPIILIVGLLVALDVGAPIVFCQRRPGLRGRPFKLYKFRTMAHAYDGAGNRIADEERSSVIGRCLRRTRLDELPQLYNVLIGDMSFVGPRPLLPIDQRPEYKARLLVRPGITGWAQVEGGRMIQPVDKAAMDVWYVRNASLALDMRIALLTIPMMVHGDRVNVRAIEQAWRDLVPTGICAGWSRPAEAQGPVPSPLDIVAPAQDSKAA